MCRSAGLLLVFRLLAMGLATGCKPKPSARPATSPAYFATTFPNESQFIVEAVASDLPEQMSYAASRHLPDNKVFSVIATEKPGSPLDKPVYDVRLRLGPNQGEVRAEVNVTGPIWPPMQKFDRPGANLAT